MSKIGKKNIIIPKESSIKIEGSHLTISGPKGTKKLSINDKIFSSKLKDTEFQILPLQKKIDNKDLDKSVLSTNNFKIKYKLLYQRLLTIICYTLTSTHFSEWV